MDGDLHNYNDEDSLLCFCFPTPLPRVLCKKTQNKTRQNKKKYTLLLELLQRGFEDYATTSIHSCDEMSGHQWQQP
jgi:hypothetical protein